MGVPGRIAAGIAVAFVVATGSLAQAPVPVAEALDVVANSNETVTEGVLSGFSTARYTVAAEPGQELRVALEADNPQAAFNVIGPDGGAPVFNGARKGRTFAQGLTRGGDYTIEVYLARAAARQSEAATFTLTVSVNGTAAPEAARPPRAAEESAGMPAGGPDFWEAVTTGTALAVLAEPAADAAVVGEVPAGTLLANGGCRVAAGQRWCAVTGRDDPALAGWVPGRNLRAAVGVGAPEAALPAASDAPAPALAATEIACATAPAQPLAACGFAADRSGGDAVLRVTLPGGGVRVIRFVNGDPVTSDGLGAFVARREAGVLKVEIGDERYEIPEAVARGG